MQFCSRQISVIPLVVEVEDVKGSSRTYCRSRQGSQPTPHLLSCTCTRQKIGPPSFLVKVKMDWDTANK